MRAASIGSNGIAFISVVQLLLPLTHANESINDAAQARAIRRKEACLPPMSESHSGSYFMNHVITGITYDDNDDDATNQETPMMFTNPWGQPRQELYGYLSLHNFITPNAVSPSSSWVPDPGTIVFNLTGDQDGWKLDAALLFAQNGSDPLAWKAPIQQGNMISVTNSLDIFHCEHAEFNFYRTINNSSRHSHQITVENLYIGASQQNGPLSAVDDQSWKRIVNPCDDNQICYAVDGVVSCQNSTAGSTTSPVASHFYKSRDDYFQKNWNNNQPDSSFPSPWNTSQFKEGHPFLYWNSKETLFQARNVNITLLQPNGNGSYATKYLFRDDKGRPEVISGNYHMVERLLWEENGAFRHVGVSFRPRKSSFLKGNSSPLREDGLQQGWRLNEVYVYGHWINHLGEIQNKLLKYQVYNLTIQVHNPSNQIFHCDKVDFPLYYYKELNEGGGKIHMGHLSAKDVYLGAFMNESTNICDMEIINPCRSSAITTVTSNTTTMLRSNSSSTGGNANKKGSYCHLQNKAIHCIDPPLSERTTNNASEPLHCSQPEPERLMYQEDNMTIIQWEGPQSFLHAHQVVTEFRDGTVLQMKDDIGRPFCVESESSGAYLTVGNAGFPLRGASRPWIEGRVDRSMVFTFYPNTAKDDKKGWQFASARLHSGTTTGDWEWLGWESTMQVSSSNDTVFHCDYFKLNFYGLDSYDEDQFHAGQDVPLTGKEIMATMVAENVTMGAHLEEGYDIAELRIYNPCHSIGKICAAVNGIVTCEDDHHSASRRIRQKDHDDKQA